jgi:DNA modification methylase
MNVLCQYHELVSVDVLKTLVNPENRNKHPAEQLKQYAKIMKVNGVRHPIVISNRSKLMTKGHGRLQAAILNKWHEFPVQYQDYESEELEYADMQADNALAAQAELDLSGIHRDLEQLGPDFDVELLGLKDFEIEPADKYADQDADAVPEARKTNIHVGDIFQLGQHRLLCGDSIKKEDVERLMNGETAELCFTSPPYADQREYNGGKDLSTEMLARFIPTAREWVRYFAVNLGYARKNNQVYPYWNDYILSAQSAGMKLLSWNVWNKGHCGSIGNQNAMFGISHEWIFVFGDEYKDLNRTVPNSHFGEKTNHTGNRQKDGSIKKSKEGIVSEFSQLKTVLSLSPQMARDEIDHPARFPVEFAQEYIEAMTRFSDFVFEPFCGSGSTLIASEKVGRRCLGMELDPQYVQIIIDRWEKFTGQKAEKL